MVLKSKFTKIVFEDLFEIPSKNGLSRPTKIRGTGVKMVNMNEVFQYDQIENIPMEYVPMNNSEKKSYLLKNNDLLFARQSLVFEGAGKCCIINNDVEDLTFESHIIRIRIDKNKADPVYIFYFFNSLTGKLLMDTIKEETAATGIRASDLAKLELSLPDLSTQKIIGTTLWELNKKIRNLKNQNKILEDFAQNLFASWFNDSIIETEGLEYKKLIDEISVTYGYPFKSELFNSEKGLPIIRIRNLKHNFSNTFTTETCDKKYHIFSGDILIGMDGEFDTSIWLGDESLLNQRVCKLYPKNKNLSNLMILFLVKQKIKEYEEKNVGTTVNHLSKPDIEELDIVFPTDKILKKYKPISETLQKKLIKNQELIFSLTKTCNALLLKLMSGEIRL